MPSSAPRPSPLDVDLDAALGEHLGTARSSTVSVWCAGTDGAAWFTRSADAPHYAASTMKLPLLIAAYRRHQRGELDLDLPVRVHNRFASALDGSPFSMAQEDDQDDATWARVGSEESLRTLARHAIVHSGNLATNLVLEEVGVDEVAGVLRDAGCSDATALPRGIEDAAAREAGLDNVVTAADLGRVMCGVAAGTLAPAETCREIEAVLAGQLYRDKIPAGLPPETYVANKTGWVTGVAHDVALVRPEGMDPYVLAVCTTSALAEDEASRLIAAVSATIWAGLTRTGLVG
ncbi:MAG TPA: serine hydrolase [Nocardioidaceae bacterium]|nr:serine hydrolase [Nocardioidaceae bacterium]